MPNHLELKVKNEKQINYIEDEVSALTSIVRPILLATLYALKHEYVQEAGGYEKIKLKTLARLYKSGDGDCGICFEYAVHDAIQNKDSRVLDKLYEASKLCNVNGQNPSSILFGIEKNGALKVIDNAKQVLTDESRIRAGNTGQPIKLKRQLENLANAFKNKKTRPSLPTSINGLWKADLFFGFTDLDRWVGTTVKINPNQLSGAPGLRIGIIPNKVGMSDRIILDDSKNLVICPIDYDFDFMQSFYDGWRLIQAFLSADAMIPKPIDLPNPVHLEVARMLKDRREFSVIEVVDVIEKFSQKGLFKTQEKTVNYEDLKGTSITNLLVAPVALNK